MADRYAAMLEALEGRIPPPPPSLRAPTLRERIADKLRDLAASDNPLIKLPMQAMSDMGAMQETIDAPIKARIQSGAGQTPIIAGEVPAYVGGPVGEAGAARALAEEAKGIKAFHGSPHDFEKFDISKIGTGEGAQAYGHGLYFAENENVARGYRDALSDMGQVLVDDQPRALNTESPVDMALLDLSQGRANPEAIRRGFTDQFADEYTRAIQQYQGRVRPARPGQMYEVELKADERHLLDWDRPLSEQPQAIQDHLRSYGIDDMSMTGRDAYNQIGGSEGMHGSTRKLQEGPGDIRGIKYLDQGSRAAGQGTRNFVMFNDLDVAIRRKYAAMLAALGGGGAAAAAATDQQQ